MRLIPFPPAWRRRSRQPPPPPRLPAVLATGPLLAADSVSQVISNTTLWITGILAGVATLFLTIGGVRYLMAGGDPAEVEKAKTSLRSAAIGYGLAILAPVIVTILKSLVGG
jgi:Type IV secretion system pilin